MKQEERQQLIDLGFDPDRLDPQSPDYDPDYGDDLKPWQINGGHTHHITKYIPQYAQIAKVLCKGGATVAELAEAFKTSAPSIYRWRHRHPEFRAALEEGREFADERVEQSLYQRAVGYSQREEQLFSHEGEVTRVEVIKHYPGDIKAQNIWLTNRRPHEWKNRREVKHEHTPVDPNDVVNVLEAARRVAFMLQRQQDIESTQLLTIDITPASPESEKVE